MSLVLRRRRGRGRAPSPGAPSRGPRIRKERLHGRRLEAVGVPALRGDATRRSRHRPGTDWRAPRRPGRAPADGPNLVRILQIEGFRSRTASCVVASSRPDLLSCVVSIKPFPVSSGGLGTSVRLFRLRCSPAETCPAPRPEKPRLFGRPPISVQSEGRRLLGGNRTDEPQRGHARFARLRDPTSSPGPPGRAAREG